MKVTFKYNKLLIFNPTHQYPQHTHSPLILPALWIVLFQISYIVAKYVQCRIYWNVNVSWTIEGPPWSLSCGCLIYNYKCVCAIGAYDYSNPANGEMCLRQDYVIKFVSDLWQVFSTNKSYGHYITEIQYCLKWR